MIFNGKISEKNLLMLLLKLDGQSPLVIKYALKCIKLYLTKFSKRKSKSIKMCCTNIYLTVDPLKFEKYCICSLLYMLVTHYQNKMLYNRVFFGANFTDLLMFSCKHRTSHSLKKQIMLFCILLNTMQFIIW